MKKNGWLALCYHTLFIVFILAPLAVVVLVSFTDKGYISMPSNGLSLRWFYAIAQAPEMVSAFWLSIWLGLAAASLSVIITVPAALAIVRYRFTGRSALMAFFMSPLMIPPVVLGVAFLRFFNLAGISGSFLWLVATHIIFVTPFVLRLVLASASGMDRDAERAAASLGAPRWVVVRRVLLPMILPGIAGGWLLAFVQSFDELTMTIFVATPGMTTLPVVMYNHIAQTIDPLITSVSTVLIVGTLLLMVLIDRIVGLERVLVGNR